MSTKQPRWIMIANMGDQNPIEYGGYFIYRDQTKVYTEEAEILEVPEPNEGINGPGWTIRRFTLERCTYQNGILSDNKFHPDYPAWFAKPEAERATRPQDTTYLADVARSMDYPEENLIKDLCSEDPTDRASAYRAIGEYHGWDNFDAYPRIYKKRSELPRRIRRMPKRIR